VPTLAAFVAGPNGFQAVRLGLALLVVWFHSYGCLSGTDLSEPLGRWTGGRYFTGTLAVQGFFVLSGFFVSQSWVRSRGTGDYLWKRLLRIWPAFVVALVLSVVVAAPLGAWVLDQPLESVKPTARLLRWPLTLGVPTVPAAFAGLPRAGELNAPLWTIRWEFLFYLLVPALVAARLFTRPRALMALWAVAVAALAVYSRGLLPSSMLLHGTLLFAPFFLAGVLAHACADRLPLPRWLLPAGLILLAAAMAAGESGRVVTPVAVASVVFGLARLAPARLPLLGARDLSYGIYLFAFPLQQLLVALHPGWQPWSLALASIAAVVPVALASWHWIESPALKFKNHLPGKLARLGRWDAPPPPATAAAAQTTPGAS